MWELVQETVNYIKDKTNFTPEYGVILGSGLGSFTDDITIEHTYRIVKFPIFQYPLCKVTKALWFLELLAIKK